MGRKEGGRSHVVKRGGTAYYWDYGGIVEVAPNPRIC